MKKLIICFFSICVLQTTNTVFAYYKTCYNYFQHEAEADKFIAQLLDVIKSNDKIKAQQFVVGNYCEPCLMHTPVQSYVSVLTNLQNNFSDFTLLQKKTKGYKSAIIIKSVKTGKLKLIRLEVDKNDTMKIFELSATDFTGDPATPIQL